MSNQATTSIMESGAPQRRLGQSALSILAGFFAVVVLSLGTDVVMHALRIYPPWSVRMSDGLFLWATAYRLVYGVLGSYITARLAPYRPMRHALIGAVIGMVLGSLGAVATWNKDLGPHWYSVALVVTGIPCAWIGGKIREAQIQKS
jgi:hypothetical protein